MGADDTTSTHHDHVEPDSRPAPNDDSANSGEPSRKDRFLEKWRAVPTPLRKTVVLVIGATLLHLLCWPANSFGPNVSSTRART